MSGLPQSDTAARARAVSSIREAKGWIAHWCPHGGDSARTADYAAADEAWELLERAQALLAARSA